jgi:hypothetical protein
MAKKAELSSTSVFLLQLCLGVFFVVLGISDLTHYDSFGSKILRAFGNNQALSLIMAVLELVMGAVLVLGLVVSVPSGMTRILGLALFVLWGVYIVVVFVANEFLKPDFLTWLYNLSWHCIILVSLWVVGRKYL